VIRQIRTKFFPKQKENLTPSAAGIFSRIGSICLANPPPSQSHLTSAIRVVEFERSAI